MATIKTKNSNGEWTVSGKATVFEKMVGQFKWAVIQEKDAYSYDLSQYIEPHDDFIFFFKSTLNSSVSAYGGDLYVLYKVNGEIKKSGWETNVADMGWWNQESKVTLSTLFPDRTDNEWSFGSTWDNDACTITFADTGSHDYGILLYAGVGEEV